MSLTENPSELLPMLVKQNDHPCFQCSQCCRYVAMEIDKPTTSKEYDYIVWYLYHEAISVFVDWSDDWYIKFDSKCKHLNSSGMCGIYDTRPVICREFGWKDCEKNNPEEAADKHLFERADDFRTWLEKSRPKQYAKYQAYLIKKKSKGEEKELKRVKITEILPAPPGS